MIQLSNTPESIACYGWLKFYFEMVGDCEPNTDGEIHLEPCHVKDIYLEYKVDQELSGNNFLAVTPFRLIWTQCFP